MGKVRRTARGTAGRGERVDALHAGGRRGAADRDGLAGKQGDIESVLTERERRRAGHADDVPSRARLRSGGPVPLRLDRRRPVLRHGRGGGQAPLGPGRDGVRPQGRTLDQHPQRGAAERHRQSTTKQVNKRTNLTLTPI